MHCPLHEDDKRSAQINFEKGVWYCQAGCGGGRIADLIRDKDEWVDPSIVATNGHAPRTTKRASKPESVTEIKIANWIQALQAKDSLRQELMDARGLTNDTLLDYEIGWDEKKRAYTIPVRSFTGDIWNVRRYQLDPPPDRRKIWGVRGMNTPRPYPVSILRDDPAYLIICEGEWDALLAIQYGFYAITRTGAAKVWQLQWNKHFQERDVYLGHDMDTAGQAGNVRVGRELSGVAHEVKVLQLPYPLEEKHGKDLTDFLMENGPEKLQELINNAIPFDADRVNPETVDPSDASVLESFDSGKIGEPLRITVTIKGKKEPGFSVPKKAKLTCTMDVGPVCDFCPMKAAGGSDNLQVHQFDPEVLEMINSSKAAVMDLLRKKEGIPKKNCPKLDIEVEEYQAVEILFARPSVQHVSGGSDDPGGYKNIKLTSVGRHDTMPNTTVQVVGALQPEPRSQANEFQAWDIVPLSDGLDNWEMDERTFERLKRFQPGETEQPLKKLARISQALARHVTQIYGRPEMHAAMDLVWHSALAFNFGGKRMDRGWLELLVVGDTRTGKSEAAKRLARHYRVGEIVSCEAATFAGVVGGLQQYGLNKEWSITWGVVPLNDRRLVVLDELSGLSTDEIAQLSDIRSRGIAQLTKIQHEATHARTRIVWLGNPRNARMSAYTWGVQAIKPLIGNAEDIARFDLAMAVRTNDVPAEIINREYTEGRLKFTSELCATLVRWAWSRKVDQIVWQEGAEKRVYELSLEIGEQYIDEPPLIQSANVREKIARVAVALAARLFSTEDGETLIVKTEHVEDAVKFMNKVYSMPGFGYAERSAELLEDIKVARKNKPAARNWLRKKDNQNLVRFLRSTSHFRSHDITEILAVDNADANLITEKLMGWRMISKEQANTNISPILHEVLREIND
jgi:hypothetical protein